MRRIGIAGAAACLALLLCAGAAQGWGYTSAAGPDPTVGRWPAWPAPTGCLGVEFDPVAVFSGPTEAENGTGGPELALRRYLDARLYAQVPTRFWRVVSADADRVSFASGRLEEGLFWLTAVRAGGDWTLDGVPRECRARTVREGNVAVRWDLAPGQRLSGRTRTLRVVLHGPRGCNGGRDLAAAAERPVFRRFGKRLAIVIWVAPLGPGPQTCEARKQSALRVRLPGRLGHRQLWDGSSYPPRRER